VANRKVYGIVAKETGKVVAEEVVMSRKKLKATIETLGSTEAMVVAPRVGVATNPSPVVWVGWVIRPGEKYFGFIRRADGTVERTRLERDDLRAAADYVTAHIIRSAPSIEVGEFSCHST